MKESNYRMQKIPIKMKSLKKRPHNMLCVFSAYIKATWAYVDNIILIMYLSGDIMVVFTHSQVRCNGV